MELNIVESFVKLNNIKPEFYEECRIVISGYLECIKDKPVTMETMIYTSVYNAWCNNIKQIGT